MFRVLFLLLCCAAPVSGQGGGPSFLRGLVTDATNGQPLPGVNVALFGDDGRTWGNASNGDGYYSIPSISPGHYRLRISFIGFKVHTDTLSLRPGEIRTYSVRLQPDVGQLDQVVVEGERVTGAAAVTAGRQSVGQVEIDRIPTPDVSGDLVSYIQTIPGVVSSGDRGGQMYIRGGTPTQNWVQIDGMPVFQPFHIVGFFSAFPSEVVQRADIYAGGFGPQFGGRLSSVVDVYARSGDKERWKGGIGLAPFVSSLRVEGPLLPQKISALLVSRESVLERALPDGRLKDELPFRFGDHFLKLHGYLEDDSQLSFTFMHTHDRGVVDRTEILKTDVPGEPPSPSTLVNQVSWTNNAAGIRYLILPKNDPFLAELTANVSHHRYETGPKDAPDRSSNIARFGIGGILTRDFGSWQLRWGGNAGYTDLIYHLGGFFQNRQDARESVIEGAAFAEFDIRLRSFSLVPGLRISSYPATQPFSLEPRFRATWHLGGQHQINAAWGVYRQEIVGLQDERDAGDVFTAWVVSPATDPTPMAMHGILGWQWRHRSGFEASLEGYAKSLDHLSIAAWSVLPRFTTHLQPADGSVFGADARLEYNRGPWYAFAGYGWSTVEYDARQESFGLWYGEPVQSFHPPHDRRHQLNLVGSYTLSGYTLSLRWNYGSGLPFTRVIGFDDWFLMNRPRDVGQDPDQYRVLFEKPYQGRLPSYHRLDVNLERDFRFKGGNLKVMAGVINAYDRRNLFYFDLWTLQRVDQLPVIPTLGMNLSLE